MKIRTTSVVLGLFLLAATAAVAQVAGIRAQRVDDARPLMLARPQQIVLPQGPRSMGVSESATQGLIDPKFEHSFAPFLADPRSGDTVALTYQEVLAISSIRPTLYVEGAKTHIIYMRSFDTLTSHPRAEMYTQYNSTSNTYTPAAAVRDTQGRRVGFGMVTMTAGVPLVATHGVVTGGSGGPRVGFTVGADDEGHFNFSDFTDIADGLDPSLAVRDDGVGLLANSGPTTARNNYAIYDITGAVKDTHWLKDTHLSPNFGGTPWRSLSGESNILTLPAGPQFTLVGSAIIEASATSAILGGFATSLDSLANIFSATSTNAGTSWNVQKLMYRYRTQTLYTQGGNVVQHSYYDPVITPEIDTDGAQFFAEPGFRAVLDGTGALHVVAQCQALDSIRDSVTPGNQHITLLGDANMCLAYWNSTDSIWAEVSPMQLARDASFDSIGRHFRNLPGFTVGSFARPALSVSPDGQTIVCVWRQPKWLTSTALGSFLPDRSPSVQSPAGWWTYPTTRTDIWGRYSTNGGRSWGPALNLTNLPGNDAPSTTNLSSAEEPTTADLLGSDATGYVLNLSYQLKSSPGLLVDRQRLLSSGPAAVVFRQIRVADMIAAGVNGSATLPSDYQVAQNYPNPFGSSTTIAYQLPSSDRAVLRVFDMLGKEVKHVELDRAGASGQIELAAAGLQTGVFRYRIETKQGYTISRQMIVVK